MTSKVLTFHGHADPAPRAVRMSEELYSRLVRQAQELNRAGLKAYGLLAGDPQGTPANPDSPPSG